MNLSLAYSPCPNDTFMFCALAAGKVSVPEMSFDISLHDVQTLNERLLTESFDVSKVSINAYLKAKDSYALLDAGAALGFGCGPIIVARSEDALKRPESVCVAVPGELTTAHLLLQLWKPAISDRVFVPYDRVMDEVLSGRADAGVIIHESRFSYQDSGLVALADLGEWWEGLTGLPIPLGGIVAKRSLGEPTLQMLSSLIRESIEFARINPEETSEYVAEYAQELSGDVLKQHISMFVNDFSIHLGEDGHSAIDRLAEMAQKLEEGLA